MPLIEGIGDEVTQFAIAVICGLVILLAWWSTGYRQQRLRTVLVMERNVRRLVRFVPRRMIVRIPIQNLAVPWSTTIVAPNEIASTDTSTSSVEDSTEPTGDLIFPLAEIPSPVTSTEPTVATTSCSTSEDTISEESTSNSSPQDVEMDSIVNAMDSETCVLRNRRLAFLKNHTADNLNKSGEPRESDKSSPSGDAFENLDEKENKEESVNRSAEGPQEEPDNDNIRIRLKFLNDDQKLVEGKLHELLGEFKRRHFRGELNTRKLVRLIFNGQVLQREGATLASCGLFDNCVVHCLVHHPRTPNQFAQVQQQVNSTVSPEINPSSGVSAQIREHFHLPTDPSRPHEERDWDLSHILLTILASILSIAWYCHIRFSSLFGIAASIAMLGLTALYFIAVICVYYPESSQTPNPNAAAANTNTTPPAETVNAE